MKSPWPSTLEDGAPDPKPPGQLTGVSGPCGFQISAIFLLEPKSLKQIRVGSTDFRLPGPMTLSGARGFQLDKRPHSKGPGAAMRGSGQVSWGMAMRPDTPQHPLGAEAGVCSSISDRGHCGSARQGATGWRGRCPLWPVPEGAAPRTDPGPRAA